jgi:serine/threonine protein kinase
VLSKTIAVRQGIEVLPADAAMFADSLDRFTKEALALTLFSKSGAAGDGVVKVITFFETNGTAYIIMEFVDGQSLAQLIADHPQGVPEAQLVAILRQLVGALACVHQHWLMHRDIKPANVFLRAEGRPVLLDFGTGAVRISVVVRARVATGLRGCAALVAIGRRPGIRSGAVCDRHHLRARAGGDGRSGCGVSRLYSRGGTRTGGGPVQARSLLCRRHRRRARPKRGTRLDAKGRSGRQCHRA